MLAHTMLLLEIAIFVVLYYFYYLLSGSSFGVDHDNFFIRLPQATIFYYLIVQHGTTYVML